MERVFSTFVVRNLPAEFPYTNPARTTFLFPVVLHHSGIISTESFTFPMFFYLMDMKCPQFFCELIFHHARLPTAGFPNIKINRNRFCFPHMCKRHTYDSISILSYKNGRTHWESFITDEIRSYQLINFHKPYLSF